MMTGSDALIQQLLARARGLASTGEDEAAKQAYVEILSRDPTHFNALNELAALALATGHRSAARTAYRQAVLCHPDNPVGRVNLGNLYFHMRRRLPSMRSSPKRTRVWRGLCMSWGRSRRRKCICAQASPVMLWW
jgi:Flp pilus assembly protein TadD